MRRFAELYDRLDRTSSTLDKVAALAAYLRDTPPGDAAWGIYFLTGRRLKRLLPARQLALWAGEAAGIAPWLFEEGYSSVGDLAETIALILDGIAKEISEEGDVPLAVWVEERILPLKQLQPEEQRERVVGYWRRLPRWEIFVLNKLLTGGLRVGVSQGLVERALAEVAGIPAPLVAHRLMGRWEPSGAFYAGVVAAEEEIAEDPARPYPFYLASPLEPGADPASLGDSGEWLVEWKWDGIRAQLLRREGVTHLWSRGEELLTERFPEIVRAAESLLPPGTVLDGEILAFRDGHPLPFAVLQKRIGRKSVSPRLLAEAPVVFMAYDLLEDGGRDVRDLSLIERRLLLEARIATASPFFLPSPRVEVEGWGAVAESRGRARDMGVEGLMLKRLGSPYRSGRKRGDWWKWKIDPLSIDAVLVYAQPGHGRRANLFTDYTFAVWRGSELAPVAKAYSGLSDPEIRELDAWIRRNTVEKFGPVRSVTPLQVFEIAFEGIARSPRHRSGIAVRFPRIARWRTDKTAEQADTLEALEALLAE
jgi:DNA ligase-1